MKFMKKDSMENKRAFSLIEKAIHYLLSKKDVSVNDIAEFVARSCAISEKIHEINAAIKKGENENVH